MKTITVEELVAENTILKMERRWIEETLQNISLETGCMRIMDAREPMHLRLAYMANLIASAKAKGVAEELLRLGGNPKELASFLRPKPGAPASFTYFMGQILSHAQVFIKMSEIALEARVDPSLR